MRKKSGGGIGSVGRRNEVELKFKEDKSGGGAMKEGGGRGEGGGTGDETGIG